MNEDVLSARISEQGRMITSLEEKNERLSRALTTARSQLVHMQEQLTQVNRPPHTMAIFLAAHVSEQQIEVMSASRRMRVAAAPDLNITNLSVGQWVRLDDKMIAIAADAMARTGSIGVVREIVEPDRLLVAAENGQEILLELAGPLRHGNLRSGDCVVIDMRAGIALERIIRSDVEQMLTPEISDVTYDDIGGLHEQIRQVRDAIELPFRHPDLYKRFGLRPPKGILLYGPPGSGKTLIAKAVAHSLSGDHAEKAYFLSIKGPELLNKFVGETERHIRAIFSRARTLAQGNVPVVIFFDEMEALFRTRGSGISSDVETMIVPQLLAEMDGVESLENVVIIGASNRADMIDPAVLRPGRLDVRIRVNRPDRAGAVEIFSKHLRSTVPLHPDEIAAAGTPEAAREAVIQAAVERLFSRTNDMALREAELADGRTLTIYLADVLSGALIAGIVERAKKYAIKDFLANSSYGLHRDHLIQGIEEEKGESVDVAASSSATEWARTIGLEAEVVALRPIRTTQ
ncbi:proteasome ATPase [Schaalia sp. lx-100]|uniref:proteasome ATPase n=1 Tax=Schaalia sp. lx-100 TaxID=2899081 RepID=UPI001E41B4C3|nr:proteasome ATPase [Schaalia sp. lx-100]MCD4558162.1 proteasome ATPase [Schaalia sp. lx-100]